MVLASRLDLKLHLRSVFQPHQPPARDIQVTSLVSSRALHRGGEILAHRVIGNPTRNALPGPGPGHGQDTIADRGPTLVVAGDCARAR